MKYDDFNHDIPEGLEAWQGEAYGRVVNSRGESVRIDTDGMGRLVEIPEGRPADGFRGMTWQERTAPVPQLRERRSMPQPMTERLQVVLDELEQLGSGTNLELDERLGWGLSILFNATAELVKIGCCDQKKGPSPNGGAPSWQFRPTGQPVPGRTLPLNTQRQLRYRRDLLSILEVRPRLTASEAATAVGCSSKRARIHLMALVDEGLVEVLHDGQPRAYGLIHRQFRLVS